MVHQPPIDVGIAVAEIGHVTPRLAVPAFVAARVKAAVVAREAAARRLEQRPALPVEVGVPLGLAAAHVVVDRVRVHLHATLVRKLDQRRQLGAPPEPGLDPAALIELAQVEQIERVVAHRHRVGGLAARGKPQGAETHAG